MGHGLTRACRAFLAPLKFRCRMSSSSSSHILIVEARFYDDMADALLDGAKVALEEAGATYDIVTVPGALEIPPPIALALYGADNGGTQDDGFLACGMGIRGGAHLFHIVPK